MWWVTQPGRALSEKASIAALEEDVDWLSSVAWRLDGFTIIASFNLSYSGKTVSFEMSYPTYFPDAPPSVRPVSELLLSNHQWGTGGELCLEHRPDNWSATVTGADMIRSAYKLLLEEATDGAAPVPSAHRMSIGQSVRGSSFRFMMPAGLIQALQSLPVGSSTPLQIQDYRFAGTWLAHPLLVGPTDSAIWQAPSLASEGLTFSGHILRLPSSSMIAGAGDLAGLRALATLGGAETLVDSWEAGWHVLAASAGNRFALYLATTQGEQSTVLAYRTILLPEHAMRLPERYSGLESKRVGIVGCGSVGSKVAVTLARSGIEKFVLIDDDVFYPGNVVRNELDKRAAGANKAKALDHVIRDVSPDAKCAVHNIRLGGQESSGSTALALTVLSGCDAIIDTSAAPEVFNLCANVSRTQRKPMLWAKVYAGGVGGVIARARPDIEPPPALARAQLESWYAFQGTPWELDTGADYEAHADDQPPMIADDGDVGIIASYLSKLTLDTLSAGPSQFPCSAYVIGFKQEWIFNGPFDVFPINFQSEGSWGPHVEPDAPRDLAVLLGDLRSEPGAE